ncbi:MAG: hypothetical protein QME94_17220 [Anaerolineae bacterium]|nr:hypothetical protein [Anaerolineae bacterium]
MRTILAASLLFTSVTLGCGGLDEPLPDDPTPIFEPAMPGGGIGGGTGVGEGSAVSTPTCGEQGGFCINKPCGIGYYGVPSSDCLKPRICCVRYEQ